MGTTPAYFEHYRYAQTRGLEFAAGGRFNDLYDTVLGADVAQQLGYRLGDAIVVAHGLGSAGITQHNDKPFRVTGILRRTGTPVDRTVHVSLEAITAIHIDWQSGIQASPGARISAEEARGRDLTPDSVTAFLVGMKSRVNTFQMQRALNDYREEPLLAIIPGVALQQLWSLVGVADLSLMIVAGFVVFAGMLGMLIAILTSLNERRREMAILRSVGARPRDIFVLLVAEAGALAFLGVLLGVVLTYAVLTLALPILERSFGLFIPMLGLSSTDLLLLSAVVLFGLLMGMAPAWRAYRNSLADGLTITV
jgi:putative ABC transport system permease protein